MSISPQQFAERIFSIEGVEALKFTAFDPYELWRILKLGGPDIAGYGGSDRHLLFNLAAGAVGAIGTNFSAFPEPFVKLYEAFKADDLPTALALARRIQSLLLDLMPFNAYARTKYALSLRGIGVGETRPQRSADYGDEGDDAGQYTDLCACES